ncbi:aspartate aminotransferase family protein [Cohnella soli]|uniref:Aspartate aminotransferase family protein n=1 Tax=Cohnella soli TaxID=425005 RepID=A0ABW0I1A8_9BACL
MLKNKPKSSYSTLHPFSYMTPFSSTTERDFQSRNICLTRGEGVWVYDGEGNRFLYATTAVPSVGLGNPFVLDRIRAQYETLNFASTCGQTHPLIEELSRRLIERSGSSFGQVFYSNDGSGAVETAMRLARQYWISKGQTKRIKFISLEGCYHGTTFGSGSVTHLGIQQSFGPGLAECYAAPVPNPYRLPLEGTLQQNINDCLHLLEELIFEVGPNEVAAVLLEPIQGVNGIVPLPPAYLKSIREITEKYGILLIMDEVATGVGRTGNWIYSHELNIQADLLTLSKGLTGGYFPMGATLISATIAEQLFGNGGIFLHGSTQSGHPVGCAAALAVLDYMDENCLISNAEQRGSSLLSTLQSALRDHPYVGDIRGKGLMLAIEFVSDRTTKSPVDFAFGEKLSAALHQEGVLGNWFNGVLILYPPLTLSPGEEAFLCQAVIKSVHSIE